MASGLSAGDDDDFDVKVPLLSRGIVLCSERCLANHWQIFFVMLLLITVFATYSLTIIPFYALLAN